MTRLFNSQIEKVRKIRKGNGITFSEIVAIPTNGIEVTDKWVATRDGEIDQYTKAGDTWWSTSVVVKGVSYTGRVAEIHRGERQYYQEDEAEEPPVGEPLNVDLHVVIRDNVVKAVLVDNETWVKAP